MAEKNPARELYDLIRPWASTPHATSVLDHRTPDGGAWWEEHVRAVELLRKIEAYLASHPWDGDDGESLYANDVTLERLRRAVFSTAAEMEIAASGTRQHLSEHDLGALQMLAMGWRADPVNPIAVAQMSELTTLITDFISGSPSLSNEGREYLTDLVAHLDKALVKITVTGDLNVRRLAHELAGALAAYFSDAAEEEHQKAEGLFQRLVGLAKNLGFPDLMKAFGVEAGKNAGQWVLPPPGQ